MVTAKKRKRRPVTQAQKDRSAASRTGAREALHAYAVLCLTNPAELEHFRDIAASIGWKLDPASDEPGYSLQNALLLAAQRRPSPTAAASTTGSARAAPWPKERSRSARGATSAGRRPTRRRPRRRSRPRTAGSPPSAGRATT
ncbi:hypothetical protein ACFQ0B_65420 [Nonomuraea thailandensis]